METANFPLGILCRRAPYPVQRPAFYVGGHLGFNWERKRIAYPGFETLWAEFTRPNPPEDAQSILMSDPARLTLNADGFHGGFQGGFNWQSGQFVFGAEVDFSWTNADDSKTVPLHFWDVVVAADTGDVIDDQFGTDQRDFPYTFKQDIKWFGTARARLGWAFDNILIYGTGGFAWKRSEITLTGVFDPEGTDWGGPVSTFAKDAKTHTGWTIGAGAEIGLTENLSLKVEWLYMDLGRETYDLHVRVPGVFIQDQPTDIITAAIPTRVKLTEHVVRLGLNWRFATAAAPPATW